SPEFANTNLDIPVIPASIRSVFDMPERRFVIDLGGDERGALALGQYGDLLNKEKSLEMLMVVNPYRPMSADVGGLREIKEEIEAACGVKFTGIVNNSNLGRETVFDDVEAVRNVVDAASDELGLPVKMTAIKRELYDEMAVKLEGRLPEMFSLDIFFPWENTIIGRTPDKTPI
ncbi:MAG: hypothetical protein FWF44_04545, partial [Defluviitaleaceae bacterium]|nr:hypothetical protein [Defluviitaleaceae bacterium]